MVHHVPTDLGAQERHTDAEPSAPECLFCGDEFDVLDSRPGTVWGHCDRCREMVAVEVEFSL